MHAPDLVLGSLLLAAPAAAQNWFDSPHVVPQNVRDVGDFSGDGDVDLLHVDGSDVFVSVNDGSGHFTARPATSLGFADVAPDGVRFGDFDGNGLLDVVAVRRSVDLVSPAALVFLQGRPDATFAAPTSYALPSVFTTPTGPVVGDSEGDGDDDVAVAYEDFASGELRVLWLRYTGAGFDASTAVAATPATGARFLDGADIDGDGDTDLVITGHDGGVVHLVDTVAGAPVPRAPFTVPTIDDVYSPRFGDVDGDGDADLIVASQDLANSLRFATLSNDGAGSFGAAVTQDASPLADAFQAHDFRVGDWDGDGDDDLGCQAWPLGGFQELSSVFENVGGTFVQGLQTSTIRGSSGGFADFDADGHLDFATSFAVVFGDGTFASQNLPAPLTTDAPLATLDFEGDGDIDLFDLSPGGAASLALNDGTGSFTVHDFQLPNLSTPGAVFRGPGAIGDFDGDRLPELLIPIVLNQPTGDVFLTLRRYEDDGSGAFVDRGNAAPVGTGPVLGRHAVVDANGDGALDLIGSGELWLNDGTGFFPAPQPAHDGALMDTGDVDADGDVDLLTSVDSFPASEIRIVINNGDGTFDATTLHVDALLTESGLLADLDGDGDLDAFAARDVYDPIGGRVLAFENQGGGVFAPARSLPETRYWIETLDAGDVDGDGALELLASSESGAPGYVWVWKCGAIGACEPQRGFFAHTPGSFGDFDDDGDTDFAGASVVRSLFRGVEDAGQTIQFGAGAPGTGGAVPVLGLDGPLTQGLLGAFHIRRGRGGALSFLVVGDVLDPMPATAPGVTIYPSNVLLFLPFFLDGTPGAPAVGQADIPFFISPALSGLTLYAQIFISDPGAPNGGLAATNPITGVYPE